VAVKEAVLPFARFPGSVNFRRYRLSQLRRADAFLYVRTAMSESGAFEVSYNVFAEPRAPMFFEDPEDLRVDLEHFFRRIAKTAASAPISPATRQTWRTEPERTDLWPRPNVYTRLGGSPQSGSARRPGANVVRLQADHLDRG
jgi:hypothetical protein